MTQIVRAGEADVFHTRQQHTYKVAQIGRRLAQLCQEHHKDEAVSLGVDIEAVEAACLAHDLGHPPFGHAGEAALNELVMAEGDPDGFEGNAQTFRIITKLGVRFTEVSGLNLTRATLAACLKYPWFRDATHPSRNKKWGAYKDDAESFEFARQYHTGSDQTAEAALMDWADDIAYSVHDLEDFHRCNAIPWRVILEDRGELDIIASAKDRWHAAPHDAETQLEEAYHRIVALINFFPPDLLAPYDGSRSQRVSLRTFTSELTGRFIKSTKLTNEGSGLDVPRSIEAEVRLLKEITRHYIISRPSLLAQQRGQKKIISDIFTALTSESESGPPGYVPNRLKYLWDLRSSLARYAADCISSLTEREIVSLHDRMFGTNAGSVLDPIVR